MVRISLGITIRVSISTYLHKNYLCPCLELAQLILPHLLLEELFDISPKTGLAAGYVLRNVDNYTL